MVGLEGHPAPWDVLWGEADRWHGVSELSGRRYERLERRGRWGALGGRRWDVFRSRRVSGGRGFVAATVILAAATAEPPGHEAQVLVVLETHLHGGAAQHQT